MVACIRDIDSAFVAEQFPAIQSLVWPWHAWLNTDAYRRHVDDMEAMGAATVAMANGPVLKGDAIPRAFDSARNHAGRPTIPGPDQSVLDGLLAGIAPAGTEATPIPA